MSKDEDQSLDELIGQLTKEIGDGFDTSGLANPGDKSRYSQSSFPTTMNCWQAFDELLACYSLGGQTRHYYRHGTINYCRDGRAKWKFCMFAKLSGPEEQQRRIARFYMERLARQKLEKGSSEDIWKVRQQALVKPFEE